MARPQPIIVQRPIIKDTGWSDLSQGVANWLPFIQFMAQQKTKEEQKTQADKLLQDMYTQPAPQGMTSVSNGPVQGSPIDVPQNTIMPTLTPLQRLQQFFRDKQETKITGGTVTPQAPLTQGGFALNQLSGKEQLNPQYNMAKAAMMTNPEEFGKQLTAFMFPKPDQSTNLDEVLAQKVNKGEITLAQAYALKQNMKELTPEQQAFKNLTPQEQKTILLKGTTQNLTPREKAFGDLTPEEQKQILLNETTGLSEQKSFEAETNTDPSLRGSDYYQQKIMDWRKQKATETKININAPTDEQSKVLTTAYVNGQISPSLAAGRGGAGQVTKNILNTNALKEYPKFDVNKAEANYKYMTDPKNLLTIGFVSALLSPGTQGISRIDSLGQKIDALNNLDPKLVNKSLNYIKTQIGSPLVVDYESLRNAIVSEANVVLSGTVVPSDYRIKLELENLGSSSSPAQLKVALANLRSALISRQDAAVSVPYPWDVVKGEKSMEQYLKEMRGQDKNTNNPNISKPNQPPINNPLKNMSDKDLLKELNK